MSLIYPGRARCATKKRRPVFVMNRASQVDIRERVSSSTLDYDKPRRLTDSYQQQHPVLQGDVLDRCGEISQ